MTRFPTPLTPPAPLQPHCCCKPSSGLNNFSFAPFLFVPLAPSHPLGLSELSSPQGGSHWLFKVGPPLLTPTHILSPCCISFPSHRTSYHFGYLFQIIACRLPLERSLPEGGHTPDFTPGAPLARVGVQQISVKGMNGVTALAGSHR